MVASYGSRLSGGRTVTTEAELIEAVLNEHQPRGQHEWDHCPCWCGENAPNMHRHQALKILETLRKNHVVR